MTTSFPTVEKAPSTGDRDRADLRLVRLGVSLVLVGLLVLAVVMLFFTTVDGGAFRHAADYWLTGAGLPIALGGTMVSWGVHRLHHGDDGRSGAIGTWLTTAALAELFVQLTASVAVGAELRWGPMYLVATACTFLGLAVQAAGSWRAGLLPRWMLGVWPLLWVLGSFAAFGPSPALLAVFLVVLAVTLTRRVSARR